MQTYFIAVTNAAYAHVQIVLLPPPFRCVGDADSTEWTAEGVLLRILDVQRAYLDAADGGSELVSTGLLKHSASDGQRLLLVFTETPYLQQSFDEHAGALGSCLVLL